MYLDDEPIIDYQNIPLVEFADIIMDMFDNQPIDKRKKEARIWINNYNILVDIYNKRADFKVFFKL